MKTIVTHISPDLDAITSTWLLKRFMPGWGSAEVKFVAAGTTLNGDPVDSNPEIAHVDTGLGRFDHHQIKGYDTSASSCTFDHLVKEGVLKKKDEEALRRITRFVTLIDNFQEVHFAEADSDTYDFLIHQLMGGLKATGMKDEDLVEFVCKILDGLHLLFKNKVKAEDEIKMGLVFTSKWGKTLAVETSNEEVVKLAQKKGFTMVVRKDPTHKHIRIKTVPDPKLDLEPIYRKILEVDAKATWYLHVNHNMLLNGSPKHPNHVPSSLSLQQMIEIIREM